MKIVGAISEKMKKQTDDTCKGTPDIEFEQDWSVGLGAMLRDGQKIKNYFSSFRDFPGKADSVILLGFECTINPQNLIKIVRAIFEKIEILIFFLCELPLILRVDRKGKTSQRQLQGDPRYRM